jgi:hypothetical protein
VQSATFQLPSVADEVDWSIVENALQQINGVHLVEAHRPTRLVTVTFSDQSSWDEIQKTLVGLGYTPDNPGFRVE